MFFEKIKINRIEISVGNLLDSCQGLHIFISIVHFFLNLWILSPKIAIKMDRNDFK